MWTELLYRVCVRPCVVGDVRPLFPISILNEKKEPFDVCIVCDRIFERYVCVGASVLIAIMACIL